MKAHNTSEESYVFVRYSEIMNLERSAKSASLALLNLERCVADIRLMSMRPEERGELLQRLMDGQDTRRLKPIPRTNSESDGLRKSTGRISKSTGLRYAGSPNGRTKKSPKR